MAHGGTWLAASVTLERLVMSGLILLGLVSQRGVDDDGAVADPDEAGSRGKKKKTVEKKTSNRTSI